MKLLDKILPKIKILAAPTDLAGIDGIDRGTYQTFRLRDRRELSKQPSEASGSLSSFNEIEETYVRNNEDAKDLIAKINGVVTINVGKANEQYEAICVVYDALSLDLNMLLKIYSFTSGEKAIFAKDAKQKNKFADILKSMNISVDVIDLVDFK